ncbi:MAG: hypothetical protein ACTIJR_09750, partial [Brevibacterium linens]
MPHIALDRLRQLFRLRARRSSLGSPQSLLLAVIVAAALVLTGTPPVASAATGPASISAHNDPHRSAPTNWLTPVPAMEVITAFDPPDQ